MAASALALDFPRQASGEGGARSDAELAVDAREVRLDRVHAQVQPRRDLLVGEALRGQRMIERGAGAIKVAAGRAQQAAAARRRGKRPRATGSLGKGLVARKAIAC